MLGWFLYFNIALTKNLPDLYWPIVRTNFFCTILLSHFVISYRYHSNCFLRYNQNKASEKLDEPKSTQKLSQELMDCFYKAWDWLEREVLPHSIVELREKMTEFADGKDLYRVQYIKKLMTNRCQDFISFCC